MDEALPLTADVGMVAGADIALGSKRKNVGEMLSEISQPASTTREQADR